MADGAAPPRKIRKTTRKTPTRQRGTSDVSAKSRMQADSDMRSASKALAVFSRVLILATLSAQDCIQDLGPVCALVGVASEVHTLARACESPHPPHHHQTFSSATWGRVARSRLCLPPFPLSLHAVIALSCRRSAPSVRDHLRPRTDPAVCQKPRVDRWHFPLPLWRWRLVVGTSGPARPPAAHIPCVATSRAVSDGFPPHCFWRARTDLFSRAMRHR